MESNIQIAVVGITGTLLGIVVSAISTYLVQKRVSERQRKWALEDDERKRESEREAEQKKVKRDLLSKRLDVLEEAIKLMVSDTSRTFGKALGLPVSHDEAGAQKRQARLEDIEEEAWATVLALGSKDLHRNWEAVSSAYWDKLHGHLDTNRWDEAQRAYVEIVKLVDDMRSQT